eukprot:8718014-Heterocapsa_arctica.AAC.1
METGQDWGHQPVGLEGGTGEQRRVARLQQGRQGQLSREDKESRQVGIDQVSNYRERTVCTSSKLFNDDRSDQHQLGHSRQ